jgi:hypothetical protein
MQAISNLMEREIEFRSEAAPAAHKTNGYPETHITLRRVRNGRTRFLTYHSVMESGT